MTSISATETIIPAASPARKKGKKIVPIAATVASATILAFGGHWLLVGRYFEKTDDAYVGGDITVMAPKVSGLIQRVVVTDNQQVHKGDLLVKIDDRDYLAALAKTEAAVASDEAAIANLDAQAQYQQSLIIQARSNVDAAAAETERLQRENTRYQTLAKEQLAISLQDFQRTNASYKQAIAGRKGAHAGLEAAQQQLAVIATQKQKAEAALQEAKAERDIAKLNVSYTELRAPIDGTIGNRSARVGSYATVGARLLSIVPSEGLWVDANFKESQLAHMQIGQPVTIKADVIPGRAFSGHVVSLAPATGAQFSILPAENATGNFTKIVQRVPVRVSLDGEAANLGLLRPGLSVTAEVDQRTHE